jgi:hypothetical protein
MMINTLKFTRSELVREPEERSLVNGKVIFAFNVKLSEKTENLNTGNKFNYENELYEIMNREKIDSPENYVKFNCFRKTADNSQALAG